MIGTILLGIVGAVGGGAVANSVFHAGDVTGISIESIATSVVGAVVVVLVARALNGS